MEHPLLRIEQSLENPYIENFRSNVKSRKLKYYARDLIGELGYRDVAQIQNTIKRVSCICKALDIPLEENVQAIFRSEGHVLYQDWILSPLGYFLVTINGQSTNPTVGEAQINLFLKYMNR
ncbi:hypothetical protein [Xanthovirga aplysinae]|uniref:hypothetical protein n=1 Tax=Xanthovirga aplysinae TaxID=2529853 RepID=UPI0012BB8134|nr:hypothetical protein [Xanthovirga aplysinae]MTI31091.1 hypothetical protein [Xanthovirga aplysinae]